VDDILGLYWVSSVNAAAVRAMFTENGLLAVRIVQSAVVLWRVGTALAFGLPAAESSHDARNPSSERAYDTQTLVQKFNLIKKPSLRRLANP
jgi:hypothetical protein